MIILRHFVIEMKLHMLSEKKRVLQEKLDSNLKDLEELQTLASLEPDTLTGKSCA